MAASFALLRDIRPYKTSWRIHVKIIHSWRQYTMKTGETLELILFDEKGVKIHAFVKKDLVACYVNNLPTGEWRFIETFSLNHAGGSLADVISNPEDLPEPLRNLIGQTFAFLVSVEKEPVFSHGQLYVALSRVTSKKGLMVLVLTKEGRIGKQTTNVVFKEVFQNLEN